MIVTDELGEHVRNQVFEAILMFDATRRQVLKHPQAKGVQIALAPETDLPLMITVQQAGKRPPRVFKVVVSEQT